MLNLYKNTKKILVKTVSNDQLFLNVFLINLLLYMILRIFHPASYSVLNYMVGPEGSFDDFYNQISLGTKLLEIPSSYIPVPTINTLYAGLKSLSRIHSLMIFSAFYILLIYLVKKITKRKDIIYLCLLHPFMFSFFRGSNDHIVTLCCVISIFYLLEKKFLYSYVFFALATIIKPAHIFFYYLLAFVVIDNKDYLKAFLFGALLVAINILLFTLNKPFGLSKIYVFFDSLKLYYEAYVLGDGGTLFNNSFFGFFKYFLLNILKIKEPIDLLINKFNSLQSYIVVFLLAVIFCLSLLKSVSKFNLLTLISIIVVFMTPVSSDYRLSFMLIPIFYLILEGESFKKYAIEIALILVICLPKHFVDFKLLPTGADITIQSIINPFLAMFLFFLVLISNVFPLKGKKLLNI